jgi:diguanylate cyclase (GGDEF)-like protein
LPKVLIVEDSKVVGSVIKKKIESELHFDVQWVQTYAETKELLKQYGHDAGDLVLKNVANIVQGRFRASDIVARICGEEFCVLACNMGTENVQGIFEQLRKKVEESEIISGKNIIKVTISTGICGNSMNTLDDMIKYADKMLSKAKEGGRNRIEV